ncbi:MAG: hypothetical protein FH748_13520 [Balneolaceae bacterium]|nr:hypothetical protein [Balneolaceae bacterium]
MERICTWAHFRNKNTDQEFIVFNAHLDHRGAESRLNAIKLILQRARDMNTNNLPILVMGDLNALPESAPIQYLASVMNDSRNSTKTPPYGPPGTFNGFDTTHPLDQRIDYIFVSDDITVLKYAALADTRQQRTPSDHLPVFIHFGMD